MISGIFTSVAFLMFLGVVYWAYNRHNRQRFEEAALLPLENDSVPFVSKVRERETFAEMPPVSKPVPQAEGSRKQCCGNCGGERP